eukprot:366151-Chlamydomonas_euryale.AAC.4
MPSGPACVGCTRASYALRAGRAACCCLWATYWLMWECSASAACARVCVCVSSPCVGSCRWTPSRPATTWSPATVANGIGQSPRGPRFAPLPPLPTHAL